MEGIESTTLQGELSLEIIYTTKFRNRIKNF
jgi:hypothetical protein